MTPPDEQRLGNAQDLSSWVSSSDSRRVYEGRQHAVFRKRRKERTVIVKTTATEAPAADAIASLRHEYEILREVELAGTVKTLGLARVGEGLALLMEDAGPNNLAQRMGGAPLQLEEFLEIAVQLAEAVALLHGARIVHRDINPTNVVWDAETRRATLVDFGIATTLSALNVERASPTQLEGTLHYISPEQTGRTGRSVDSRTDLYSLGATFYELLTGGPPFVAGDPVELVHAHLARRPRSPSDKRPEVPIILSRIILKLLEKAPEQRYQTAEALAADLREARTQFATEGTIHPFPLALHDVPRELSLPDKLYGRDNELRVLREAFARACEGRRELVLVTGDPGIGKSALVSHLEQPVTERRGLFITGKFDQLQRSLPYSGLVQAFRTLVRQLLTEPESVLSLWRERIQATPNVQVLVEVIPELERIIGPQRPVPALGPIEAKNRFVLAFTAFIRVFARPEHPFALFLDDLQWMDAASLQLLEQWMRDDESRYLLVLGAYRKDEVDSSHPLASSLAQLRETGTKLNEIHVGALTQDDISQLIADTFNKELKQARLLADLVWKKTAGNPFFVRRLLHTLHSEGLIHFAPERRAWEWDLVELDHAPVADNVLQLMAQSIQRLPEETKWLLQAGACIGHRFDLGMLAELSGRSRTATADQLWPALQDGLILPLRGAYKAPRRAGPFDQSLDELPGVVQFVHDRVQQAAYSLLSPERRRALHLEIGRRLLERSSKSQLEERLFEIVDQLDLSESLIVEPAERLRLVELNLAAGRKAKASAAYQSAFEYLGVAMRHLPERSWADHSELTLALHRERAECAYLMGQHEMAEQLIETALGYAPSKISKVDLYSLRVLAATVAGDSRRALRWGREGLAVLGQEWPLEGLSEAMEAEATAVMKNVRGRRIEDLVNEPEVDDEETRASMRLLSLLGPPAYFVGDEVLTFLVTRSTNLSLVRGASPYSAYAYVFYGALHNARTGEYDVGYAFGKLALALARRFGNRAEECRTLEVFGLVVHAWKAPLRESLPLVREGFRAGVESGELAYAAFNLNAVLINGMPAGVPLADLLADTEFAIEFATRHKNRTSIEMSVPFRQAARALMGATRTPTSFEDDGFEEPRFLQEAQGNQTAMGFFWVARLQAAYLVGDYETARRSSQEGAKRILSGILGMMTSAEHVFYTALTLAADHGPSELEELKALHRKLVSWAEHCPENFLHKHKLVEAELERLAGRPWRAMELFGEAIEGARKEGFIQDAALANELAAKLFLAHGQPRIAHVYLQAAREGYEKWGATVKVRALDAEIAKERVGSAGSNSNPKLALDSLGLIKASQAISAETAPERLFERILRIVIEVAGAQSAVLLLNEPQGLVARARIAGEEEVAASLEATPLADCHEVARSIVRYVMRLREPLVLADASAEGSFVSDPEVQERKLRSLLCVPLKKQAALVGLLYLENNAMADAFTQERVEIVQVLAAQAVISLESSSFLLERERAERSARFLASAGAALVESLDRTKTLARVVQLAVPAFADWCFLDLTDQDGGIRRVEIAHADRSRGVLAEALAQFSAAGADTQKSPSARALLEGRALLFQTLPDERLRELSYGEAQYRALRAIAPRSVICVPLLARGRTLGILTFIVSQPGRRFDPSDLAVAQELAKRCALAMDNAALYNDAQEAIRIRDEFLSIASHELKTPLTSLSLKLQTLARGAEKGLVPQGSKDLQVMRRQVKRLSELVNELLDVSRIGSGQLKLELQSMELSALVHEVAGRFESDAERAGIQLNVHANHEVVGYWDRLRLEQVVTNLLSNALKYGAGQPVEVSVELRGEHARLTVRDGGIGIEPQALSRIFEKFERAVSERHYGGLGLGLFVTRQIVEAMGGTVSAQSVPGQGATFIVELPLLPALQQ